MRISTKGRGIIRAQQGAVARPNPKENYKLPEDQRYQAQTRGMKDFAIEWYKERAKQPKYQSQVNESNLANITDQINRAEYVEPSKFYSNPNVYKGKVGNVTQAAQVAMRQNKGAAYPAGLQYTYNAPSFPFSGRFSDVSWHEGIGHMVGDNNPQILKANPGINNRVDYESSTPLESQVYSSQPNERHADTWGFRGANVNMKDANGNYYIDPNRQLKGTDIQEMRTKGAKIPSGFNTLSDDEIAKLHNTFASNTNNKRSNTMLIAKRIPRLIMEKTNELVTAAEARAEGLSLDGVANNRCITKQQFVDNLPKGGYC